MKSHTQFYVIDKLHIIECTIKIGWIDCVAEWEGNSVLNMSHWIEEWEEW